MTKINSANDPMINLQNKDAKTLTKKRSTSALWAFLGFLGFILLLWLGVSLLSSLLHQPVASDTANTSSSMATDVNNSTEPTNSSITTNSSTEPSNSSMTTTDSTTTSVTSDNQLTNQSSNTAPLLEVKPATASPAPINIGDPNASPLPVNTDSATSTSAPVTNNSVDTTSSPVTSSNPS